MIYIPIEIQLRMIREDLEQIKHGLAFEVPQETYCPDCAFANVHFMWLGQTTCQRHAPELNNVMSIKFTDEGL